MVWGVGIEGWVDFDVVVNGGTVEEGKAEYGGGATWRRPSTCVGTELCFDGKAVGVEAGGLDAIMFCWLVVGPAWIWALTAV